MKLAFMPLYGQWWVHYITIRGFAGATTWVKWRIFPRHGIYVRLLSRGDIICEFSFLKYRRLHATAPNCRYRRGSAKKVIKIFIYWVWLYFAFAPPIILLPIHFRCRHFHTLMKYRWLREAEIDTKIIEVFALATSFRQMLNIGPDDWFAYRRTYWEMFDVLFKQQHPRPRQWPNFSIMQSLQCRMSLDNAQSQPTLAFSGVISK